MRPSFAPVLMLAALVLAGCEVMPAGLRDRFGPPPARTRNFPAEPRAVFEAARAALDQMAFRVTAGGPAQGRIEAVSRLSTGDSLRSTRQISMSIRITEIAIGSCEVSVLVKEAVESDSFERQGFATETPVRDAPDYDIFFDYLGQALAVPKKG